MTGTKLFLDPQWIWWLWDRATVWDVFKLLRLWDPNLNLHKTNRGTTTHQPRQQRRVAGLPYRDGLQTLASLVNVELYFFYTRATRLQCIPRSDTGNYLLIVEINFVLCMLWSNHSRSLFTDAFGFRLLLETILLSFYMVVFYDLIMSVRMQK